jgi:hypothetical protein
MGARSDTKREFAPETQARIDRKAERDERMRASALDALDVGRGWSGPGRSPDPVFDGGTDLSLRMSDASVRAGRQLRPHEEREIRRELRAEQAGQRAARQPQSRKPNIRARLEAMSPAERDAAEATIQDPEVRAYAARIRAEVEAVEEEAEYLAAVDHEERTLAEIEDDEPYDWSVHEGIVDQAAAANDEQAETYIDWEAVTDPNASDIEDGYEEDE